MENLVQKDDGSTAFVNAHDAVLDMHFGGGDPLSNAPRRIVERVGVLKLTAADTAGGVFAWNPGAQVIVTRVLVHVKTAATGACTIDVGVAANGTTSSDTLLDGLDVNSAAGLFDNIADHGTDGLARVLVGATQYLTASKASGATAGLVGYAYIHYYPTF